VPGSLAAATYFLTFVVMIAGSVGAHAQESHLLAEEPSGTVEVTGETRVIVAGLAGEITVQRGPVGMLSFQSRSHDEARGPVAVAMRLEDGVFRLGPTATAGERRLSVVLSIPPELLAEVETADSKVKLLGLLGGVRVRGSGLDVEVEWCEGRVSLDVDGGRVRAAQSPGGIEIRGRNVDAVVSASAGPLNVRTVGGRIEAREVGGVGGETERSEVELDGAHGPVRLSARGGSVLAKNLALGGSFQMSAAPLSVRRSRGQIEIESDSDVRFSETDTVRVTGYGATVAGVSNAVAVEVHADGGTVTLANLGGSATVSGSGLKLSLSRLTSARVDVATSQVQIDGVGGSLEVSGDESDVEIANAANEVTVRTRGGNVRVRDQIGPVDVRAEGERVEVSWGTQFPAKSSTVQNDGGSVAVVFPPGAGCRVEAETRYGRIESEFPGIEITSEGTKAAGHLGPANQSTLIRIVADRDITLSTRRAEE